MHEKALMDTYSTALAELRYWAADPEGVSEASHAKTKVELLRRSLEIFGLAPALASPRRFYPPKTRLSASDIDRLLLNPLKTGAQLTLIEMLEAARKSPALSGVKTLRQKTLLNAQIERRLKRHVASGLVTQTGPHYRFAGRRL